MSYGGIGNILSQVGGMALTPALETYIQDYLSKSLVDADLLKDLDPEEREMLGNVAGGTLGTLLSTGLNAGLGYATGGKEGAAAGAAQGLIMGGGAALQHDKFKETMGMGAAPNKPAPGTAMASTYGTNEDPTKITGAEAWNEAARKAPVQIGNTSTAASVPEVSKTVEVTDNTKPETSADDKPGYFELAGKLGLPAWTIGAGLGSSMAYANRQEEIARKLEAEKAAEAAKMQEFYSMLGDLYRPAYAGGGGLTVSSNAGAPASVTFPDWFIDEFAGTGGLGSYASGGYINTEPMDPDTAYPQSMIHRARPYPAASPIPHEVVSMEKGGLLEGEGDGMSDHIPANIDGKEPVRVADGEYVVPANVAERFGEERLHAMMNKVRSAAHAKKGKQIVENAGKRAFIQTMSRVKA
jgi:hypothetical protein